MIMVRNNGRGVMKITKLYEHFIIEFASNDSSYVRQLKRG